MITFGVMVFASSGAAQDEAVDPDVYVEEDDAVEWLSDDDYNEDETLENGEIYDPLEPVNRVFFEFNDKLYFWVLKPVSTGYAEVLPEDIRYCIGNFFSNLASPVRLVNNLLQGDFEGAGTVLSRFAINTTVGVFGFGDPAGREFDIAPRPADFGQTLGKYGIGDGFYICWPVFGPSSLRDTAGLLGDMYVQPISHVDIEAWENGLYNATERVNSLSMNPGQYEKLLKYSFDPYVATRQLYYEYRQQKIGTREEGWSDE